MPYLGVKGVDHWSNQDKWSNQALKKGGRGASPLGVKGVEYLGVNIVYIIIYYIY